MLFILQELNQFVMSIDKLYMLLLAVTLVLFDFVYLEKKLKCILNNINHVGTLFHIRKKYSYKFEVDVEYMRLRAVLLFLYFLVSSFVNSNFLVNIGYLLLILLFFYQISKKIIFMFRLKNIYW